MYKLYNIICIKSRIHCGMVIGPCLEEKEASEEDLYFDCGDKYCVNRSLVCNGHYNCQNLRDEAFCSNDTLRGNLTMLQSYDY